MKLNSYDFETHWHIPAQTADVVSVMENVEQWPDWWQGLISSSVQRESKDLIGSMATMLWQSLAGYKLHIQLKITDYKPGHTITFESAGDLQGVGSWTFTETGSETDMIMTWRVHTTKTWMNILAPVMRPVFVYSHHKMMKQGEVGLKKYIAR